MKTPHKSKNSPGRNDTRHLSLGDLVLATYSACGEQRAPKLLQLAIESNVVRFARPQSPA